MKEHMKRTKVISFETFKYYCKNRVKSDMSKLWESPEYDISKRCGGTRYNCVDSSVIGKSCSIRYCPLWNNF